MAAIEPPPRPPRVAAHGIDEARRLLGARGPADAVVVVGPLPAGKLLAPAPLAPLRQALDRLLKLDPGLSSGEPSTTLVPAGGLPGGRLVVACTGRVDRHTDDVRAYAEAAEAGAKKALKSGAKDPLLVVLAPDEPRYARALEVAVLGALGSLWRSVEARTHEPRKGPKARSIHVLGPYKPDGGLARALEQGRSVARDIAGTQPEVMTPEAAAAYVESVFRTGPVSVGVERDLDAIRKGYPLLHSVSRGANHVERFLPRVVRLEYDPGRAKRTVFLVGKGVTYDTGGHNIKIGGGMAGMSRDKSGAAAVAGVMRVVQLLSPPGVRVVGYLGLVRNAVDAEAYVTDEIIASRAGVRVRIGNTDAEGRLVLADILAAAREEAEKALDPLLVTIATLTGHAQRAVGPYPIAIENGPALAADVGGLLQRTGALWGEPFERSVLRREDYEAVKAKTDAEDVLSMNANIQPTTPRGHQLPVAFFQIASKLEKNGKATLPFVHLDIAGSAVRGGDWAYGVPTASTVVALYEALVAP